MREKLVPVDKLYIKAKKTAMQVCVAKGFSEVSGATTNLQAHHIIKQNQCKALWWNLDNLLCVTRDEHKRFESREIYWIEWLMNNIPARYLLLVRRSREEQLPNRWEIEGIIRDLQSQLT
jgi:hypothetical protein